MTDLRADLAGKRAFVTGGGTGIGRSIALALADAGAEVVVTGRREEPLKAVAAESSRIAWRVMDVTDEREVVDAVASAGRIDIMVPNAGIAETQPMHKMTLDFWRKVQSTNVEGVMLCVREAIKPMAERGWGRIIIVSSIAGLGGFAYGGAYCASKHAVLGLMKCAAEEVLKSGVTVNALCPGYVATPIIERSVDNIVAKAGITEEEALASLRDVNPFGRMIEPDEVAAAALWLCGPGSGAVTAQAIRISGGQVP
ncbi:MAG: SDR family NAD(P)-dependent oxidoreductase [Pseudomonadota bacterium]